MRINLIPLLLGQIADSPAPFALRIRLAGIDWSGKTQESGLTISVRWPHGHHLQRPSGRFFLSRNGNYWPVSVLAEHGINQ
jgi:hypothetical protein